MIVPATRDLAQYIGANLRAQDVKELGFLQPGESPVSIVVAGVFQSEPHSFVALWHGKPMMIFGAAPIPGTRMGAAWMLATEKITEARRYVGHFALPWIKWLNTLYPELYNCTHVENSVALQWLEATGFELEEAIELNGAQFIPFRRTPYV